MVDFLLAGKGSIRLGRKSAQADGGGQPDLCYEFSLRHSILLFSKVADRGS
jgi:hypothetical protein